MKLLNFIIILLALTSQVWAQNEAFELANQAYQKENYEQAIIQYKQLIEEGYHDADLYFNLGNAYYKSQQVGLSILNFEKALKLKPNNNKIEHNLRLAYLQTINQVEPLPKLFFVKWWHTYLSNKTAAQWGIRAVIFIWLAIAFLIARLFIKSKLLKNTAIVLFVFALYFSFIAYQKNKFDVNNEMAIVMQNEIELKETPNSSAKTMFIINEGLKLQIIDQVDKWSQIKLEDGSTAWLKTKYLERI